MGTLKRPYAVVPSAIYKFLGQSLPFRQLDQETLEHLARQCIVASFPKGTLIFKQDVTEITHVHVIQTGGVRLSMVTKDGGVTLKEYSGEGESFGASSIVHGRPAEFDVESVKDTFCILIAKDIFLTLLKENPWLADHYKETMSETLFGDAYNEQRTQRVGARSNESLHFFNTRIWDVVKEPPEVVDSDASVQEVGTMMSRLGIGSVLVRNNEGAIVGIVRNQDLKSRVVAVGLPYDTPVEKIMVQPVKTVPAPAFCFEAVLTMIRDNMDHLAIQHRDTIIGVMNTKDMMVYLGSAPLYLFREIAEHRNLSGLNKLARKVPFLVRQLIESGAKAASVTQMLTVFTDHILERILALAQEELGPPPCAFAWLGLASEGRRERTFKRDQDNALLFEQIKDEKKHAYIQSYFQSLGEKVVADLEKAGHPRCLNDFVASNPRWCTNIAAWKKHFEYWIQVGMPPDISISTIFFDFRPVAGEPLLADRLRSYVLDLAKQYPAFLKNFVKYFLINEPPVSFFADSFVEKDDTKVSELNLKTRTLTPFVEFARIMSLLHGIHETNTLARVQALHAGGFIPLDLFADMSKAYEYNLHLSLTHQLNMIESGGVPEYMVKVSQLSELERKALKFSFSVMERMMAHVRKTFY